MIGMFLVWKLVKRTKFVKRGVMDLVTDRYDSDPNEDDTVEGDEQERQRRVWESCIGGSGNGKRGLVLGKVKRVGMWLFL